MTQPELKPCPFCGSRTGPTVLTEPTKSKWSWVQCKTCGAESPEGSSSAKVAIEIWNHRPTEQALIAALKSLLHCPAIADGNHSNLEWGCQETVDAERKARQALEKAGVK